jgi:hypothetical protein
MQLRASNVGARKARDLVTNVLLAALTCSMVLAPTATTLDATMSALCVKVGMISFHS